MSAGAVIIIRRRHLAKRSRAVGGTNPERAVALAELGERPCWIFDQIVRHGVFVAAGAGCYYLDQRRAVAFFRRKRLQTLTMTAVLLLLILLLWLLGMLGH